MFATLLVVISNEKFNIRSSLGKCIQNNSDTGKIDHSIY